MSFLLSLRDAGRRHMLSSSIHHIAKYNTTLRRSPFVSSPYMHSRNYDKAAAFVCPVQFSRVLAFFRTFLEGVPVLKGRAHSVEYALSSCSSLNCVKVACGILCQREGAAAELGQGPRYAPASRRPGPGQGETRREAQALAHVSRSADVGHPRLAAARQGPARATHRNDQQATQA